MQKAPLPIDKYIPEILNLLKKNNSLIIRAAPGAGKTTRIPPALLSQDNKEVWILEPRRIAALAASKRISEECGWQWGEEVGYQVRFDNRSGPKTKLLFLTEALLLKKIIQDPLLNKVGAIVLDEFHERSLSVDLALSTLRELQELSRPDLKIIVMSATLSMENLQKFLGNAPVIDVEGKLFPMKIHYHDKPLQLRTDFIFIDKVCSLIQTACNEQSGDLLCFLPGKSEIERCRQQLADWAMARKILLYPLHGQLSLDQQRQVLVPHPEKRRIILATNLAESSLTVEGVNIVVDSGLARVAEIHPRTGLPSLQIRRISLASATQRAGRSARTKPGFVYRAWHRAEEASFPAFDIPEILRSDLSETILLLASLGITKPENFSWFEAPNEKNLAQAQEYLQTIQAIDDHGRLTALGEKIRSLPVHPRIALVLINAAECNHAKLGAAIAAILSEGILKKSHFTALENDLYGPLSEWLSQARLGQKSWLQRTIDQLFENITNLYPEKNFSQNADLQNWENIISEILFLAYSDRLCRRRKKGSTQAKMIGGRGVVLHSESSVKESEYFLALDLGEGKDHSETTVFTAFGLSNDFVEEKVAGKLCDEVNVEWDENQKRFWAYIGKSWHGLSIGNIHQRPATPDEIQADLQNIALKEFPTILRNNETLSRWWLRLEYWEKIFNQNIRTPDWLAKIVEQFCYGETSLQKVWEKELVAYFENALTNEILARFNTECPEFWLAPSGSRLRIKYTENQGAEVEVRLQEVFGLMQNPIIAGKSLTLSLLAPNYRPVQITRDIKSFWQNGYPEVRKEMRLRYPKHSWPENPFQAAPQAKGRPRQ